MPLLGSHPVSGALHVSYVVPKGMPLLVLVNPFETDAPVRVEVHAQVHGPLAQEAQVLARSRPAQHAEMLLLCGRNDHVQPPDVAGLCPEVAEDVVKPEGDAAERHMRDA